MTRRTVLVTGASGAMGAQLSATLAQHGWQVVCADIRDSQMMADVIASSGGNAIAIGLDVTDEASWDRAVGAASDAFGGVDGLVNTAGLSGGENDWAGAVVPERWREILDVNVVGAALGICKLLPLLKQSTAGRVVNIASVTGLRGLKRSAAYSASKGAIVALTRQAAVDLASEGITVNGIAPGMMRHSMAGRDGTSPIRMERISRQPIPRAVQAAEVASAVEYLLSPSAGMTTGQILAIDGGWTGSL